MVGLIVASGRPSIIYPVYVGLDLLSFETSFRRVLVNMIILQGILRISVLLFTHLVFLMNELDIAYAHQLIGEMYCTKHTEWL